MPPSRSVSRAFFLLVPSVRTTSIIHITLTLYPVNAVPSDDLKGRTTNVSYATNEKSGLKGKFLGDDKPLTRQPDMLKTFYELAKKEPHVLNHVLEMMSSQVFSDSVGAILFERLFEKPDAQERAPEVASSLDSATAMMRHLANPPKGGVRVLPRAVFHDPLMPATDLTGDEFLKCWLDTLQSDCPSML